MSSYFTVFVTLSTLCLSSIASAQQYYTVHLDVLGYSKKQQRVYILESPIHSQSKQKVYYYDLKKPEYDFAHYENSTMQAQTPTEFEQRLHDLKKDLQPLIPIDQKYLNLHVLQQNTTYRADHLKPFSISYSTQFKITADQFQSHPQNLVHYSPDIQLKQAYVLPKQKGILVTFNALAYPFDEGFHREKSVILLPYAKNK